MNMGYNSFVYLGALLPAALVAYSIAPSKLRKYVLLLVSWGYFFLLSKWLVIYLIVATLVVYTIGLASEDETRRKALPVVGMVWLFMTLFVVKYTNFTIDNLNHLFSWLGSAQTLPTVKILAPIGISYYTLEAVGYLAEVRWGRIKPEHDFVKLALFLSFFPQIMEGPIASYQDTADQLVEGKQITAVNLRDGSVRILWGLFKKMLIADRLNTMVAHMYSHYESYSGVMILAAGIAFTIQLYMEFSGVMDIIMGSGQLFGMTLPENFKQPFFAQSASEFWRRWHITLGVWLKTYLFYPITTSKLVTRWIKFSKKKLKNKYLSKVGTSAMALLPVWLFNGLWHGPHLNYIVYGLYYFVLLLLEVILEPLKVDFYHKTGWNKDAVGVTLLRILRTWGMIVLGEMYFRASSVAMGNAMIVKIFTDFEVRTLQDGALLGVGLDYGDYGVILIGTLIVFLVDLAAEWKMDLFSWIAGRRKVVRWTAYYALIMALVIFGAYGTGYQQVDLIYAGF